MYDVGSLSRSVFFAYLKQFFAENVLEFWVVVQDFCRFYLDVIQWFVVA